MTVSPFIKWAGGKRQLLPQIEERMPQNYNNYYEPFIGGGAVLFNFQPENAVINDINRALINTYRQIRDVPNDFMQQLQSLDESMWEDGREYYYSLRERYNEKLILEEYDMELSTLFVFLNKHCFNGLYRVNSKGLFNVPYNNSRRVSFVEEDILDTSEYLRNINIVEGDFQIACNDAREGDFIFLDSPYAPVNPTSFESYTKEGFDIESHRRLAELFHELTERGCRCMLTNHNTELIEELYGNRRYRMDVVTVRRSINANANNRVGQEIIICNY